MLAVGVTRAVEVFSKNTRGLIVAITLTAIAGMVDAVGYLTFSKIYTANMSGNSVAGGISIGEWNGPMFLLRFWPILMYVFGLLFGRALLEVAGRLSFRRAASAAFVCEIAALALVASVPHRFEWASIALLAWAMGVQNAALTHFSSLTLHSGFVTGTLLKFAEQLVKYATWIWDQTFTHHNALPTALSASWSNSAFRLTLFLMLIWVAYITGAAIGTLGQHSSGTRTLLLAIGGLLCLVATDFHQPLAVNDERQQVAAS